MPLSWRKAKPIFSAARLMAVVLLVVMRMFWGSTLRTEKVLWRSLDSRQSGGSMMIRSRSRRRRSVKGLGASYELSMFFISG